MDTLKTIYRWFFREVPLFSISVRNFLKRTFLNARRPVFKLPNAGLLSAARFDSRNYYWLRFYPEPRTHRHFENLTITRRYRLFASRRWRGYSSLHVLGKSTIDPYTGEPKSISSEGGTHGGTDVCLLRFRTPEDDANYYHFHYDVLAKLKVLDDAGVEPDIPLLISDDLYRSKLFQSASKRGSLARRCWLSDEGRPMTFDRVIVSNPPPIGEELIDTLLKYVDAPQPDLSSTLRVYIFRGPSAQRRVVNGAEIIEISRRYGFEPVDAAEMSYEDQMSFFSRARYLIIDHGAAVTNIMFRRGAPISVLEIYPTSKINPTGFWISDSIGGKHTGLICDIASDARRSPEGLEDYYVNPADFEESVRKILQN